MRDFFKKPPRQNEKKAPKELKSLGKWLVGKSSDTTGRKETLQNEKI